MSIKTLLIGKLARPDHTATVANPNGRDGFIIHDAKIEDGRLAVRGEDTMWFGESALLEIVDAPPPVDPMEPTADELRMWDERSAAEAVRLYRGRTNSGLRDAVEMFKSKGKRIL